MACCSWRRCSRRSSCRPWPAWSGSPFALLLRAEERLARGALVREPSRTALTVGSLTIGLAMIVALAAVGQSDRHAASAWLTDVIPGDEIATSIRPVGLDEGVQADLAAVAGVERVSPIGRFDLAYLGVRLDGAAMSGADLLRRRPADRSSTGDRRRRSPGSTQAARSPARDPGAAASAFGSAIT